MAFTPGIASTIALGLVKVDGVSITVTSGGLIAATGSGSIATTTTLGVVKVPAAGGLLIDGSGNVTLNTATTSQLGGVKVDGTSITIAAGVISASGSASTATATTLGVVKVPTANGLSVSGAGAVQMAIAGAASLGVVQVPAANGLSVDGSGNIAIAAGTASVLGALKVPTANGLSVTAGSVAVALATGVAAGTVIVPTSHGLSVSAGSVAMAIATASTLGTVQVPSANGLSVDGSGNVAIGLASSSVFGVVKVDGTTITASGGVISAVAAASANYSLIGTSALSGSSVVFTSFTNEDLIVEIVQATANTSQGLAIDLSSDGGVSYPLTVIMLNPAGTGPSSAVTSFTGLHIGRGTSFANLTTANQVTPWELTSTSTGVGQFDMGAAVNAIKVRTGSTWTGGTVNLYAR